MTLRPEPYHHLVREKTFRGLDGLARVAEARGVSLPALAMAWVLSHPLTTAVIIGPRKPEHLDPASAALEIKLGKEERAELAAFFV